MKPYLAGAGITAACTAVGVFLFPHVEVRDLIMIYLIGVVVVSTVFGLWPSVATSALSVLALDFFFVPPYGAFSIQDLSYAVTIGVMFVVGVIMGGLTDRVRLEGELSRLRERRMAVLYALGRDLSAVRELSELCLVAQRHVEELFDCRVVLYLREGGDSLRTPTGMSRGFPEEEHDEDAARSAFTRGEAVGHGTATFAALRTTYLPLSAAGGTVGVIGIRPTRASPMGDPEQRNLLVTVTRLIASALESALSAKEAEQARREVEAERLRSGLLGSISHDLRTPLATIEGAATTMLQGNAQLTLVARNELTQAIVDESKRLGRLVRNLLDMTRLESGQMRPNKERQVIEELVGGALTRVETRLGGRPVRTRIDDDLPLVPMDAVLIEQVLINLLENADRHSSVSDAIEILASASDTEVRIEVADVGSGLLAGTEERIFEKFYRGNLGGGTGLGLAICRAIVSAHGGRIWAENRVSGGASLKFVLPLGEPLEDEATPSASGIDG